MRDHGCIVSAGGLGLHDHACWTYDDDADYAAALVEFLEDGLRRQQRLLYVAGWPAAKLIEDLEPLGDPAALVGRGDLVIGPAEAPVG
ncbi:MAG: MEDS domain-containing protein, partial [Actinomycetota bacterium]